MEYLMENLWLVWIGIGILFLIVEAITTPLISIWFAIAAFITCVISLFIDSFAWQLGIFIVLSAVLLVVCRKVYNKYIKKPVDDINQNEKLVGKVATVTEDTNGISGRVLVGDVYWRAVTEKGDTISQNETVLIKGVKGTTLVIEKM